MTYEEFVQEQLISGASVDQIRDGINTATLPLFGRCGFCGKPASLLCDHIIGWTGMVVNEGVERLSSKSLHHTCDTPLCGNCAVNLGITFSEEGSETIDVCPDHPNPHGLNPTGMTEEQAELWRTRRRMYMFNHLKTK